VVSGRVIAMFGWFKSKVKKELSNKAGKAIYQCENFIGFTWI
jgi:hypothetical protein